MPFQKRFRKVFKTGFRLFRDNSVVQLLNYYGLNFMANSYNWLTTDSQQVLVMTLCAKMGITTIQSKYLILLIISFLL